MTDITAAVIADFRVAYPNYSSIIDYPDPVVTDCLCDGDVETGGSAWGDYVESDCKNQKRRGMFLYAAHCIAVNFSSAGSGDKNTAQSGAMSSKTVGDESITVQTGAIKNIGDAWLSSTSFGQQFSRLSRRMGQGVFLV